MPLVFLIVFALLVLFFSFKIFKAVGFFTFFKVMMKVLTFKFKALKELVSVKVVFFSILNLGAFIGLLISAAFYLEQS